MRTVLLYMLMMPLLVGCTADSTLPDEKTDTKDVIISFCLPSSVESRALTEADENSIQSMHLLLFEPDGGFVSVVRGENINNTATANIKTFTVTLQPGTYDIILLANVEGLLGSYAEGTSRQHIIKDLTIQNQGKWIADDGSSAPIPMWGEKKNILIDGDTDLQTSPVPMIRSIVRIDIRIDNAVLNGIGGGKLVSVYMYNHYTKGQIIPDNNTVNFISYDPFYMVSSPSLTETKTRGPLIYIFDDPVEECIATIYTFEAAQGSGNDLLNNTCLVLGIGTEYTGGILSSLPSGDKQLTKAGSEPTYTDRKAWFYRVDFVQDTGGTDTYIPLLRNHNYVVTVNKIINQGFPEPGQAFRSEPYGISYEVVPYTEVEQDIQGATYRLDITSTDVKFGAWRPNISTVSITTTHPDGWYAQLSVSPDMMSGTVDWLTLDPVAGAVQPSGVTVPLQITAEEYDDYFDDRTAYIHITSGNLTNVIRVTQAHLEVN